MLVGSQFCKKNMDGKLRNTVGWCLDLLFYLVTRHFVVKPLCSFLIFFVWSCLRINLGSMPKCRRPTYLKGRAVMPHFYQLLYNALGRGQCSLPCWCAKHIRRASIPYSHFRCERSHKMHLDGGVICLENWSILWIDGRALPWGRSRSCCPMI